MKKQRILLCLMIFALLLSACAGKDASAVTGAPESDAAGASSSANEPALPAPALDPAAQEGDAAGPEPAALHTLTEEEMAALWQQLDGVWRLNNPGSYDGGELMCLFTRLESGEFVLIDAVVASEGIYQYINEVTEQNGAYQFTIDRTGGVMSVSEYEPDARSVITLVLQEDGTLEINSHSPARYGHRFEDTSESEMGILVSHYRCATAEEEQLLKDSAEGYLWLENGDILSGAYVSGPMQFHRETPEEEHARIG